MSSELTASSLERPAPPSDAVLAETPAKTVPIARERKTEREKRWERRRRRRWGEEVLAWILVPIILICVFWAVKGGLTALGTSPTALYQQIRAIANGKA